MKTKCQFLLIALALFGLAPMVKAQFTFTTNNGAITITGYNTAAGVNAIIPSTTNGYPVNSIDMEAFYLSGIASVVIPGSVTNIGIGAFGVCTNLVSVIVPGGTIGYEAFIDCTNLASVTIGNGGTSIGQGAFLLCNGLTNVIVLGGTIETKAFYQCSNLVSATIGNGVTSIGDQAFAGDTSLRSMPIGNGVTLIGMETFAGDTSLASVIIPNSVTSLGDQAFEDTGLTNVIIPDSVTNIDSSAFAICSNLANVTIGTGVVVFTNSDSIFADCTALTGVYFHSNAPIPSNDTSMFYGDTNAVAYYLRGTTGWGPTFDGIPTALYFLPPPAAAIGLYSNQPAVFFSSPLGNHFLLQMTTNLVSGTWVTVSNSVPVYGFMLTNAPPNAFFRLQ